MWLSTFVEPHSMKKKKCLTCLCICLIPTSIFSSYFFFFQNFFQNSFQKNNERNCNVYFLFDVPFINHSAEYIHLCKVYPSHCNVHQCKLYTMYTDCTLTKYVQVIYFQWSHFLYFLLSKSYDLIECMNMNQKNTQ